MSETPNRYTPTWFDLFLPTLSAEQTAREVAFLARQLPLPTYQHVLDLCCGWGRHAIALADAGYDVTGLDRDPVAIALAQKHAQSQGLGAQPTFVVEDMLHIGALPGARRQLWPYLSTRLRQL